MSNITFWDHLFFVLIAILLPVLSLIRGKVDMEGVEMEISDKRKFYFANAGILWVGAVMVFLLWLIAGRPFVDMGIRSPVTDTLVVGLTILFVVAYIVETATELRKENKESEILKAAPFLPQNYNEFFAFLFLAFSAGVCEEIVYRGFLVNYLLSVINNPVVAFNVAVIFPAVIFGVVHMYQGIKSVLKISIMSLLFSTIFIFSQSLLIVMILHFSVDAIGGYIGLKVALKAKSRSNHPHFDEEE